MLEKILIISFFTAIIHMADTLSYSIRLAGVKTGKLAVAMSLTGIIVLVSRTSNIVQAPLTGGLIDFARENNSFQILTSLRIIIASASVGTVIAIFLFPTFVSLSIRFISHFEIAGSIPRMIRSSVSIEKLKHVKYHIRFPKWEMLSKLRFSGVPNRLLLLNLVVTSIYTIGVLAALYASILIPKLQMTAAMSSGLINGIATIIFIIFVDPQVALMTDKAMKNEEEKEKMSKVYGLLMISRLLGTLLAQIIFIPAAYWVAWISPLFY